MRNLILLLVQKNFVLLLRKGNRLKTNRLPHNTQNSISAALPKQNNIICSNMQFLATPLLIANHELLTEELQNCLYFYQAIFLVTFNTVVKWYKVKVDTNCCAAASKLIACCCPDKPLTEYKAPSPPDSAFILPLCRRIWASIATTHPATHVT